MILLQALIYLFYKGVWVLPVAGFMVGYATNLIALKLIFSPAEPIELGCYTLQVLLTCAARPVYPQHNLLCDTNGTSGRPAMQQSPTCPHRW